MQPCCFGHLPNTIFDRTWSVDWSCTFTFPFPPSNICLSFLPIIFFSTYSTIHHVSFFLLRSIPIQGMQAPSPWHHYITPTLQVLLAPVWLVLMLTEAQPAPLSAQSSSSPLLPILRTCPAYLTFHPFRYVCFLYISMIVCKYIHDVCVTCIFQHVLASPVGRCRYEQLCESFVTLHHSDHATSVRPPRHQLLTWLVNSVWIFR